MFRYINLNIQGIMGLLISSSLDNEDSFLLGHNGYTIFGWKLHTEADLFQSASQTFFFWKIRHKILDTKTFFAGHGVPAYLLHYVLCRSRRP